MAALFCRVLQVNAAASGAGVAQALTVAQAARLASGLARVVVVEVSHAATDDPQYRTECAFATGTAGQLVL